jgi:threonylcarbamoyladenosine tRNA methylthiotransferase MtaB
MPQLGLGVAKERGRRLRAKGEDARARRYRTLAGMTRSVLVEKPGFGHSECFAPVAFDGAAMPGAIVLVLVTGTDGQKLLGRQAA